MAVLGDNGLRPTGKQLDVDTLVGECWRREPPAARATRVTATKQRLAASAAYSRGWPAWRFTY